jgi:hypothetical protein
VWRKTDEFPVPLTAALIGPLMTIPKNAWLSRNTPENSSDSRFGARSSQPGVLDRMFDLVGFKPTSNYFGAHSASIAFSFGTE